MASVKSWVRAMRLRTLPLAASSILMGGALAFQFNFFRPIIFFLSLLTTVFLQILSNLANDYGDAFTGVDSESREGPSRTVSSGEILPKSMKNAIVLFGILSLVTGLYLVYIAFGKVDYVFLLFVIIGLFAIAAAVKYTMGKSPYGYKGLGDVFVFFFFGLVGVLGSYFLHAEMVSVELVLPAIFCGLFSTGVLNVNNMRDIQSDSEAGKRSIPVRLGIEKARSYHILLVIFGYLSMVVFTVLTFTSIYQFTFLIALPVLIVHIKKVTQLEGKNLDPLLKELSLATLGIVILYGIGLMPLLFIR